MRKASSYVVLELPDGCGEITLWTSGSAFLYNEDDGSTDLEAFIEAEGVWTESGGTEEEFRAAVSYLDSIR